MKKSKLSSSRKFSHKGIVIASFFAVALLALGAKKTYDLAAPPVADKPCDFIYPVSSSEKSAIAKLFDTAKKNMISLMQKGGFINDASCVNKTAIHGIVDVQKEEDIKKALKYARENKLKVTMAGQRHSMGGQTFTHGGLVLDIRNFKKMKLNKEEKIINVQSGTTWESIQKLLDKEGLAVKAMQSINIFTVGGTLSVNAHGIAHDPGPVAPTVKSMRVMLADGSIVKTSPTENAELFKHVLGGYGLFGVILDVDLEVVPNEMYQWNTTYMDYTEFPEFYTKNVDGKEEVGLMYGRLSMAPSTYLKETAAHTFTKVDYKEKIPDMKSPSQNWMNRLVINFSKTGDMGRWLRWTLEKNVEPKVHTCLSRNTAMNQKEEACLVSRNQEMYDAMGYLKNRLPDTDILQEYFIPHDQMPAFIDGLRKTVKENDANLLNVTIRIVSKDEVTALPYAKQDMFAFVLYFNQKFNEKESKILQKTTVDLIDVATKVGGTYYLPYQLYYSPEQLRKAYPEVDSFFAMKKKYDPEQLFSNKWYQKYGK